MNAAALEAFLKFWGRYECDYDLTVYKAERRAAKAAWEECWQQCCESIGITTNDGSEDHEGLVR